MESATCQTAQQATCLQPARPPPRYASGPTRKMPPHDALLGPPKHIASWAPAAAQDWTAVDAVLILCHTAKLD